MFTKRIAFTLFIQIPLPWAGVTLCRADTWTNAAGNRLEAKLAGGTDRTAVFERADGSTLRMAMASLKTADQVRAKALLRRMGVLPPERAKPVPGDALSQRAQRLRVAGEMSDAQADRIRDALKRQSTR